MATYQKRGRAWRAIVRKKSTTTTKTFDTKAEAVDWATAIEAKIAAGELVELARQQVIAEKNGGQTVADLFQRYSDEVSPTKRGGRWEQVRLKMFIRDFDEFQKSALAFSGPDLADWRDKRLKQIAAGSVARELNLISAVFTRAIKEWRLDKPANPCWLITKPQKPRARKQRVSDDAKKAIVDWLGWDQASVPQTHRQWAAATFCFALETAMRKGEALSLDWRDIHEKERYAHLDMTKNGDERDVPLSKAALALLKVIGWGEPDEKVFKIHSGYLDILIREAREKTDLLHVRFHDTRREATTNIAAKLSNVLELSAVTGHRDIRTLKIYFAPKPASLAEKMDM